MRPKKKRQLIAEIMKADEQSKSEKPVFTYIPLSSPAPFSMTFTWKSDVIKVELENGEDVLKLAQIFSDFLTSNDIPNKIIIGKKLNKK